MSDEEDLPASPSQASVRDQSHATSTTDSTVIELQVNAATASLRWISRAARQAGDATLVAHPPRQSRSDPNGRRQQSGRWRRCGGTMRRWSGD